MTSLASAITAERAGRRAVIRWHALYARCRSRMARMDPVAAERLHLRLKEETDAAIDAHFAAMHCVRDAAAAEGVVFLADRIRARQDIDDVIDDAARDAGIALSLDDRVYLRGILRRGPDGMLDDAPDILFAFRRAYLHWRAARMTSTDAVLMVLIRQSEAWHGAQHEASG